MKNYIYLIGILSLALLSCKADKKQANTEDNLRISKEQPIHVKNPKTDYPNDIRPALSSRSAVASEENEYSNEEMTQIQFDKTNYNFGKISAKKGKVSHYFHFTNSGSNPLMIKVRPGCGCTVGSAPKKPILPGKKDSILLEFDPSNFVGKTINKSATVRGNIPETVSLKFTAEVQP